MAFHAIKAGEGDAFDRRARRLMALLPVPGGELWAEQEGEGEAMLLIQGLGNASWPSRFHGAGGRRTIALDNRGTGRSLKPPAPYSIEQHADDAAAVLEAFGVERAHVIGHSMGGYVAQTLALRRPDLVRSLVLVGTGAGVPTHEPVPRSTLDVWLASAHRPPPEYARATMHLSFAPGWTDQHPDEYEAFLATRLEHPTPPECWRAQYESATRWVLAGAPIEEITAPVLVVHDEADRVVPISNGRGIAGRIAGAELHVVPGAGHYVQLEDPERFDRLVERFLERVD